LKGFLENEQGAVSLYLILIIVPIFLFCAVFIDFARIKAAEKESENAVKTGLRSALSAFNRDLHSYGLYALNPDMEQSADLFHSVVTNNLSGHLAHSSFKYIDTTLKPESERLIAMYSLANHDVLKRQMVEEMKYRAPIMYGLEITDAFKSSGAAERMKSAARFAANAEKAEALLKERDRWLDTAWDNFVNIHTKAGTDYPFYETNLERLNELSGRIGTHTVEEVRQSINDGKQQLQRLKDSVENIDDSLSSLARAGANAYEAVKSLLETRDALANQINELTTKLAEWEQLLNDLLEYAKLLTALKLKSTNDYTALTEMNDKFNEALVKAGKANDELNSELKRIEAENAGDPLGANAIFQNLHVIGKPDLDDYTSQVAATVSLFGGLKSQLQAVVFFTTEQYNSTSETNREYYSKANSLYAEQSRKEAARNRNQDHAERSRREQRTKAQPFLDQAVKAMGSCSIVSAGDSFQPLYEALQGDPAKGGTGYFQAYMEMNGESSVVEIMDEVKLDNADHAGQSAMKLLDKLGDLVQEARDDMYINEFALSKFNYRTYGLEKDNAGNVRQTVDLSDPASHPLSNQEVEFMIYGSNSCAGNYSKAYAEMFAIRLGIRTLEALMEPRNEVLNAGSPLLVLLAAVAEGVMAAQTDMVKLLDGQAVPLSDKIGQTFTLHYKDYLRLFLLLHGRDKVMLSRMQALLQLNTGIDLRQKATYVQGSLTSTVRLWFLPGLMRAIRSVGVHDCIPAGNRCEIHKTAYMAY